MVLSPLMAQPRLQGDNQYVDGEVCAGGEEYIDALSAWILSQHRSRGRLFLRRLLLQTLEML